MLSEESSGSDFEESDFSDPEDDTEHHAEITGWKEGDDLKPPFTFSGEPGITANFENEVSAFRHFFSDDMIALILEETNRFGRALQGLAKTSNSRALVWEDVTFNEIMTFFVIHLIMGLVKKPSLSDYWSEDPILNTPIFSQLMSRNRFQSILRALHFANNESSDKNDKLYKIRKFIDLALERFQTYTPKDILSIDELLQKFKGRLQWKQYIPSKRARYGIKLFLVCESDTSFVFNFIIYTGRDTLSGNHPSDCDGRLYLPHHLHYFATRLVLSLTDPLKGKGYTLVLDNYFNSLELTKRAIECGFDIYGTVNKSRKDLPSSFFRPSRSKERPSLLHLQKE